MTGCVKLPNDNLLLTDSAVASVGRPLDTSTVSARLAAEVSASQLPPPCDNDTLPADTAAAEVTADCEVVPVSLPSGCDVAIPNLTPPDMVGSRSVLNGCLVVDAAETTCELVLRGFVGEDTTGTDNATTGASTHSHALLSHCLAV